MDQCQYVLGWSRTTGPRLCGSTHRVRRLPSPVEAPVPICAEHAVYSEHPAAEWDAALEQVSGSR